MFLKIYRNLKSVKYSNWYLAFAGLSFLSQILILIIGAFVNWDLCRLLKCLLLFCPYTIAAPLAMGFRIKLFYRED
ncbi:hypothetical protein C4569_02290 [Candidatus Parcubacteria bacterium]|nr:MAG: hypothetical protein C4569_02290 [Candidatus Parcubacteria bacterium]